VIAITPTIALEPREVRFEPLRASGPGGQNVNKVETAVQLRFDVLRSPSLPEDVRQRLAALAGRRLSLGGVLVITAQRYRSQERNRADALARLADLVRRAARPETARRPTRPTRASRERRLAAKASRAALKATRRGPGED
jgi:ribosome-associated protein